MESDFQYRAGLFYFWKFKFLSINGIYQVLYKKIGRYSLATGGIGDGQFILWIIDQPGMGAKYISAVPKKILIPVGK